MRKEGGKRLKARNTPSALVCWRERLRFDAERVLILRGTRVDPVSAIVFLSPGLSQACQSSALTQAHEPPPPRPGPCCGLLEVPAAASVSWPSVTDCLLLLSLFLMLLSSSISNNEQQEEEGSPTEGQVREEAKGRGHMESLLTGCGVVPPLSPHDLLWRSLFSGLCCFNWARSSGSLNDDSLARGMPFFLCLLFDLS